MPSADAIRCPHASLPYCAPQLVDHIVTNAANRSWCPHGSPCDGRPPLGERAALPLVSPPGMVETPRLEAKRRFVGVPRGDDTEYPPT
jgi:hypothetical protein